MKLSKVNDDDNDNLGLLLWECLLDRLYRRLNSCLPDRMWPKLWSLSSVDDRLEKEVTHKLSEVYTDET